MGRGGRLANTEKSNGLNDYVKTATSFLKTSKQTSKKSLSRLREEGGEKIGR
jgi:hypothetical protein